jgi:hypothetical protein
MIYPSISDLTRGKYNRYTLVIATAKCARMVTDEYVKQREHAEKMIANKDNDNKSLVSMIKREYRDEKAVKNAINRLYNRTYKISDPSLEVDAVTETDETPACDTESETSEE